MVCAAAMPTIGRSVPKQIMLVNRRSEIAHKVRLLVDFFAACLDGFERQIEEGSSFGIQNAYRSGWTSFTGGIRPMKRNASDNLLHPRLRQSDIRGECERIQSGWSRSERQRRAGLAAVRQYALWEAISQKPGVVAVDRRSVAC